jgi:hypothetical protein
MKSPVSYIFYSRPNESFSPIKVDQFILIFAAGRMRMFGSCAARTRKSGRKRSDRA